MAEIDVIVPVYKVDRFLDACVKSIQNQSFGNFELILVDDGSPDECSRMCDEFAAKDSRIVVVHGTNRGVSAARNLGIELCNSKYITFCDSDDFYSEKNLKSLYNESVMHNADLVSGNYRNVTTDGEVLDSSNKEAALYSLQSEHDIFEYIVAMFSGRMGWSVWTKLFSTSLVQNHNIRFCTTCENLTEDLGFVLEYILYCHEIVITDYCGYNYVQYENSMMHTTKDVIKFNSSNEVSKQFGERFYNAIKSKEVKKLFPMLFYCIWQIELFKMHGQYNRLEEENNRILDQKWFRKNMSKVLFMYKPIKHFFGKGFAKEAVLFASFEVLSWRKLFDVIYIMKHRTGSLIRKG